MKFLIAEKENMISVFSDNGKNIPATVLNVLPVTVTQIKTKESDDYNAIQFGYGVQKEHRVTKALKGHTKELGHFKGMKELRVPNTSAFSRGQIFNTESFAVGDIVSISGTSKGKGFQGVVKRHGFHGGPRSHGQKHSEREPGSIGGGLRNRVPKGMRMAGRTGQNKITLRKLKIVAIDVESNKIVLGGSLPGRRGSIVEISSK